jgi:Fur family iron response transcriptional regulator
VAASRVDQCRAARGAKRGILGRFGMAEFSHGSFRADAPPSKYPHRSLLERYGLRATRQRLGLARLLFSKGNRHVTADTLAAEAHALKMPASLATVYNVLNLFAEVGIVRGLTIEGAKTVFDTNTSDHSHFLFEDTGEIEDIPLQGMQVAGDVTPPEGYEIAKVDVVIRLRRVARIRCESAGARTLGEGRGNGKSEAFNRLWRAN